MARKAKNFATPPAVSITAVRQYLTDAFNDIGLPSLPKGHDDERVERLEPFTKIVDVDDRTAFEHSLQAIMGLRAPIRLDTLLQRTSRRTLGELLDEFVRLCNAANVSESSYL